MPTKISLKKIYSIIIISIILNLLLSNSVLADANSMSLFPLDNYDQNIATWINPTEKNYDDRILDETTQKEHVTNLREHYFGNTSPWNQHYVTKIFQSAPPNDLKTVEKNIIQWFDNDKKSANEIGYGANFRAYTADWIENIRENINVDQFDLNFDPNKRAIAIRNLSGRALPTNEINFNNPSIAGQGYPFDNLQMSSIWIGTPLYIIATSQDKAWHYVLTPDFLAWVPSDGVALMNQSEIDNWQTTANNKLIAVLKTHTILQPEGGKFMQDTYVGTILPGINNGNEIKVLVPIATENNLAKIVLAKVNQQDIATIPLPMTRRNIANIMSTLIGRTYGWGGMYFYNDCSAELKSLLAPFGIYLGRHSSDQVHTGKMIDQSSLSKADRLAYLMKEGKPFLNIVYIGGHVFLYLGNYPNPNSKDHQEQAMIYQNIWGLAPIPPNRRAVIGEAVIFPLLLQYPEDTTLNSLAGKKYFQVSFLDELNTFALLKAESVIDIAHLAYPERDEN